MSLKVLFDEQIFLLQRNGGISRYFIELIKQFQKNPQFGIEPIVLNTYAQNSSLLEEASFQTKELKHANEAYLRIFQSLLGNRFGSSAPDLVHHTFYLPGFWGRFPRIPKVVTLFDMIPEMTDSRNFIWSPHFMKKSFIAKADGVLSISQTSTSDMRTIYNSQRSVINTYLGVSEDFKPGLPRHHDAPEAYILFVGNRSGYKDFDLALKAFASAWPAHRKNHLLLVGGGQLTPKERELITQSGVSERVSHLNLSVAELASVYSNAKALVYPTRREGFGLPLLEAMASGVPILASDTIINREIAGPVGSYFPVGEVSSLSSLILAVTAEDESFSDKVELGFERVKQFTWEECARKTAEAYRAVVQKNKKGRF
jgi:glycosyltransferase involved in cell wall biosynthesis